MSVATRCGLALACFALSVACGSNSNGLVALQTIELPNLDGVAGFQDIVVAHWIPFTGGETLQVYRQDPANPDRLLVNGSVSLTGGLANARDIGVTADLGRSDLGPDEPGSP
jgi:hypothetical protein